MFFLALWPLVYFWRVTIGEGAFSGGDLYNFFLPVRSELARALAEGRLPLWTPNLDSGFPLLAEGQVGALYPLNILFHRFFPVPLALSYTTLVHSAWALIGMYLFCRSSRVQVGGAVLAAFAFGFSGFFLAHLPHSAMSTVASWLPWILYFQNKFWQCESLQDSSAMLWLFLSSLSIGLEWLTGSPQLALYNVFVFAIFGPLGFLLWHRSVGAIGARGIAQWIGAFARSIVMTMLPILIGTAIGAVQLLPTMELVDLSTRVQDASAKFFSSYALQPEMLAQFIFPFSLLVEQEPSLDDQELWGYIGIAPLLLAFLAPWLRRDMRTRLFFLIGLLFVSLSLGDSNPFYHLLYNLPLINRFRVPARFLFYAVFIATFLAGVGFDELQGRLASKKSGMITWGLGIGFVALAITGIVERDLQPVSFWIELWNWLPWLLLAVSLLLIFVAFRGYISKFAFGVAILGVTCLDLLAFALPFSSGLDTISSPSELIQVPLSVSFIQPQSLYRMFTHSENPRIGPNRPAVYNIQSAQIYSPLSIQRNEEYLSDLSPAMLSLLNVRYYLPPLRTKDGTYPEPAASLIFQPLENKIDLLAIQTARIEIVTFADQTENLPDGFLVGELALSAASGDQITLPLRLGSETADWAFQALAQANRVKYQRPANASSFSASLLPFAREFQGLKYTARYDLPAPTAITQVRARSYLPKGGLTIERISLIDPDGRSTSLAELTRHSDFTMAFKSQALEVLENLSVLPRAFIVHQAMLVNDDHVLQLMRNPGFQPARMVLLNDGEPMEEKDKLQQSSDLVVIDDYQSERVSLSVKTEQPGYLVLTDSWYPGWEAFVDGQRAQIHRADYIFRALDIQPGAHSVVFEYRPQPFYYGAIVSGTSLLVSGVVTGIIYWQRRRSKT